MSKEAKHYNWKGGLPKCLDCGKELSNYNNKRCTKCVRIGKLNFRWKGGKQTNTEGYVLVLSKNHPFASCRGYIFEHRLVMEAHIGRYLKTEETVHHINGIKDDNRIENLMLFIGRGKHLTYHKQLRIKNRRIKNGD